MGQQPSREKEHTLDGSKNDTFKFVTSSIRGQRETQEDAHLSQIGLGDQFKSWSMFGVFDGHAGDKVSTKVSQNLVSYFLNTDYIKSLTSEDDYDIEKIKEAVTQAYIALDQMLLDAWITERQRLLEILTNDPNDATYFDGIKRYAEDPGCTATVCLITNKHYFFINLGDSRQILVKKDESWNGYRDEIHKIYETSENSKITDWAGFEDVKWEDPGTTHKYNREETYSNWLTLAEGKGRQLHEVSVKFKGQVRAKKKHELDNSCYSYPEMDRNRKRTDKLGFFYDHYCTIDHKPSDPEETARVEAAGGKVERFRVDGDLAVSRAFGDFRLKADPGISEKYFEEEKNLRGNKFSNEEVKEKFTCEFSYYETFKATPEKRKITVIPHIDVMERNDQEDAYLVVACDGLFDVLHNECLVQFLTYQLMCQKSLVNVVYSGLDMAYKLNTADNLSLTLVKLAQCPEVDSALVAKEKANDKKVTEQIESFFTSKATKEDYKRFDIRHQPDPAEKMLSILYARDRNQKDEEKKLWKGENENYSFLERVYGKDYIFPYGMPFRANLPRLFIDDEHYGAGMSKYPLVEKYLVSGEKKERSKAYMKMEKETAESGDGRGDPRMMGMDPRMDPRMMQGRGGYF